LQPLLQLLLLLLLLVCDVIPQLRMSRSCRQLTTTLISSYKKGDGWSHSSNSMQEVLSAPSLLWHLLSVSTGMGCRAAAARVHCAMLLLMSALPPLLADSMHGWVSVVSLNATTTLLCHGAVAAAVHAQVK
jgi:hypothetical protein